MARIRTTNIIDGGERVPTTTSTSVQAPAIDPQDVRGKTSGLTPAQVAAQKALNEAVAAGAALGIRTTPGAATAGNVPTVSVTKTPVSKGDNGYWVHDASKDTTNSDGSVNWNEYWSTDPSKTRVTVVRPQVFPGGDTSGSGSSASSDLSKLLTAQQAAAALAAQQAAQAAAEEKRRQGQSAYALLFSEFERYGLGALVEPLKGFITEGLSPAEFTLRLRETDAYKKRFAANAQRINKGLRALSEAEYIQLEDQYQNIMRNYGLPASYYARGEMGIQQGFEKFISGDVSAAELEDRIQTAQNRVINAAPEVSRALREFYPDITNGDILAYTLDPEKALTDIRRRVTAAEIGAGAMQAGLRTGLARAEELGRFGITGEQARQGFQAVAEVLPTATKLGEIYAKQGMGPFTQETAEQEVFGITGAAEAAQKRRRLQQLETAAFSGTSGAAGGALGRERAGAF